MQIEQNELKLLQGLIIISKIQKQNYEEQIQNGIIFKVSNQHTFANQFKYNSFLQCKHKGLGADTTTYFNKYICTGGTASKVVGTGDATYALKGIDTALYLGDSSSTSFRPTVSTDFGLLFTGEQFAYVKASNTYTLFSNELRYSGSSVTMWAYIFDNQRDQTLVCKQNRNSGNDVSDKLCLGIKNGYFYASMLGETLAFDAEVQEGWNFIAFLIQMDAASAYSRLRVVAYSRSKVVASYKTFSYAYQDDVSYDLLIGGKYAYDGLTIKSGFSGYILELRLYSTVLLTLDNLDNMVDYDCTTNTAQLLCEMCPMYVTSTANICLEDFSTSKTIANYQKAKYSFNGAPSGTSRYYFGSTVGTQIFNFYFGNAPSDARTLDNEPHRSEVNGLYFDGNDYMSNQISANQLTLDKYFTIELWVRFTQSKITQNQYLFQKIKTSGVDTPFFQFYFAPNNSFIVDFNKSQALEVLNVYNTSSFPESWVYIGVSFATLYYPVDKESFQSKICMYLWGPYNYEKSGCGVINDYYDEVTEKPYFFDTRIGQGFTGFIRNAYIWKTYKSLTHMYYTPRRNYPLKNKCSPFTGEGYPTCFGCDQYLASATCFSSCYTNSYSSSYLYCLDRNCTNEQCTSCYSDSSSRSNNYCTACIENAFITSGELGNCKCKDGYYLDSDKNQCLLCHQNCDTCYGPSNSQCYKCKHHKPNWKGKCLDSCQQIDQPYNETYTYVEKSNTCEPCFDFYYTTDWMKCIAQPYPMQISNYNNRYLIMRFSSPVKYFGDTIDNIITLSISGPNEPYSFSWRAPYWESNTYAKDVFLELDIPQILNGDEKIFLYISNVFISDSRGYQLLARNSSSRSEFLPLSTDLLAQDYLSPSEKAIIEGTGTGILISLLTALAFNALIMFLSSGTNSDVSIFANFFAYIFNLNGNTFPNDYALHSNFNQNGYSSMKIVMNLQSQMMIIVVFVVFYCLLNIAKNMSLRCCGKGKILHNLEQSFIYNTFIRFYLEGFLEINTSAYINILNQRHKFHQNKEIKEQFGSLFEEYKHKKWFHYMHTTFFIARRTLFIMTLMIMVFVMMRPYKDEILNTFSIINEIFLFVIGCYLFIFVENQKQSTVQFYFNICFIFPFKIYETYLAFKDRRRIERLRFISEVEQKYLNFDYKKFFLSTLKLYKNKEPQLIQKKKEEMQIKPTEIYNPSDQDESSSSEERSLRSGDNIPPEAYSTNQPIQTNSKPITPITNGPGDPQGIFQESLSENEQDDFYMDHDDINPNAIVIDQKRFSKFNRPQSEGDNQIGFLWLNDNNNPPPIYEQDLPIKDQNIQRRKKSVKFQDPAMTQSLNNTDAFKKRRQSRAARGFFDYMIKHQDSLQKSDDIFKSENDNQSQQDQYNQIWQQQK
ncbi:UNKNOWN [Stylonychia lemnae]|uniref:Uncharacterized protein n=1 Tax=Stylonychia lemnae TaxID=5949 RepID=A0A078AN84_STYLE|nr:UNKNOWN [Stylonychia lemnae]|eukprot:CDW83830.1 UNKNOWN [Stylonychia lemnae]